MTTEVNKTKPKWKTVSLPKRLIDDIQEIIDEFGYWTSLSSFVREAAIEKLKQERRTLRKGVDEE